jgi:hypothetical protein
MEQAISVAMKKRIVGIQNSRFLDSVWCFNKMLKPKHRPCELNHFKVQL